MRRWLVAAAFVGGAVAALLAADRALPPTLERAGEFSILVVDREDRLLRAFTTADGKWRLRAGVEDVDPVYLEVLKAYEDRRFDRHAGVDPLALLRATAQAATSLRVVSGASTLTMQTARLLEPRPRTLEAKLAEIGRALQLERRLAKDEILGLYLSLAPFGGNIEGVRAAALAWLGKEPKRLTLAEAALLVAMPQSPERVRPDRDPLAARAARDKVLRVLAARGAIAPRAAEEAMQEPVPVRRLALPFIAPHLAESLRAGAAAGARVRTTLDRNLQRAVEQLASREHAFLDDGANLAILVVENATRAVRAWMAGADFGAAQGQVDLVRARRSPGSALKPFLYGLAFDDGWLHPETRIGDHAMRFGDFAPRNFDRGFQGEVSARAALQQSLNVPAVAVLDRLGPARLIGALSAAGAALDFDRRALEAPSLPVILGGVGISLADMTMLYAALADEGRARPLEILRDAPAIDATPAPLMEARAASWVREILRGVPAPEPYAQRGLARAIAYKTGTSYGFRDAWALGVTKRWTIGVWVGRADGTPRPGQYGRSAAAPILFKAFDLLPPESSAGEGAIRIAAAPPALQRLVPRGAENRPWKDGERSLAILFPPDGATVELERLGDAMTPLALKAEGGRGLLTWIVNGMPLDRAARADSRAWTPEGDGFVKLVVVDERGESASATVRIVVPR